MFHYLDCYGFINLLILINYVAISCHILDVERYSRIVLKILDTTAVNLDNTVYVQVERRQQLDIIEICQKGHSKFMVDGERVMPQGAPL